MQITDHDHHSGGSFLTMQSSPILYRRKFCANSVSPVAVLLPGLDTCFGIIDPIIILSIKLPVVKTSSFFTECNCRVSLNRDWGWQPGRYNMNSIFEFHDGMGSFINCYYTTMRGRRCQSEKGKIVRRDAGPNFTDNVPKTAWDGQIQRCRRCDDL